MDEEKRAEILMEFLETYKERKSKTGIALICAAAWVATVALVGKAALLLAIPGFVVALAAMDK